VSSDGYLASAPVLEAESHVDVQLVTVDLIDHFVEALADRLFAETAMDGLDHRAHVLADSPYVEASMSFDLEELPARRKRSVGDEQAASVEAVDLKLMKIVPAARAERESPRDTVRRGPPPR
jgi:hypothetical protein